MSLTRVTFSMIERMATPDEFSTPELAAKYAYENNAQMHIQEGDIVKLVCNPSAGDDFQAMCKWISGNHYRTEPQTAANSNTPSTALYLEIANGLHNVETFIDVTETRFLDIRATGAPDFISITGATFANIGTDAEAGILYSATITLASALPSQVVAGFAVGGQNVQGDGGADCLNGGFIVESVALDRLSLVVKFRNHGVAPLAFTTPDSTASLGLTPNQLLVPKTTIRAQASGWGTGASREGFINAVNGGKINLTNIGISYNGITSAHDLLFASGQGSEIRLADRVILAGAGEYVVRSSYDASVYTNRSCIGGGIYARSVAVCSGGSNSFIRTMLGSSFDACAVAILNGNIDLILSVANNSSIGIRTTYPTAGINTASSRFSRFNNVVQIEQGNIFLDTDTSVEYSTTPILLAGPGFVAGNFKLANNTNAVLTPFEYSNRNGIYFPTFERAKDPQLENILVANKTYVAADFGTIAANSSIDVSSTATATSTSYYWLSTDHNVLIKRAGSGLFQLGLNHQAFVTTSSTVGTYKATGTTTVTVTMANSFSPGDSVPLQFLFNNGAILLNSTYTVVTANSTQFTFTHGTAVQGEGRVSLNNGIITLRVDNLTVSTYSPTNVTIRLTVLKVLTP